MVERLYGWLTACNSLNDNVGVEQIAHRELPFFSDRTLPLNRIFP